MKDREVVPQSTSTLANSETLPRTQISSEFIRCARQFLKDEYLPKIERCLNNLTDKQIWWRANPESNSIGNLLLHLSGNARQWIVSGLGGEIDRRMRQTEFDERSEISRDELLSRLRKTLADVDRSLASLDPARILDRHQIQELEVTALEAIFHVVEHFSMHTGQIILLTKMLAEKDLGFYDFSTAAPVHTWHEPKTK